MVETCSSLAQIEGMNSWIRYGFRGAPVRMRVGGGSPRSHVWCWPLWSFPESRMELSLKSYFYIAESRIQMLDKRTNIQLRSYARLIQDQACALSRITLLTHNSSQIGDQSFCHLLVSQYLFPMHFLLRLCAIEFIHLWQPSVCDQLYLSSSLMAPAHCRSHLISFTCC